MSPSDRERSLNGWVDIYNEGMIASWMLVIALLHQTGGRVSYRDVHNRLYQRFGSSRKGFTDADILAILQQLTGKSWSGWWATHVQSPVAADFETLLAPVGLKLTYSDSDSPKAWAGWRASESGGALRLSAVQKGSPAWDAGFGADDILVAIDGQRMSSDRLSSLMSEHKPGDEVTVSFFRRDQLIQKKLKLGSSPGSAKIVRASRPTAAQKALFRRWLGIPYPAK